MLLSFSASEAWHSGDGEIVLVGDDAHLSATVIRLCHILNSAKSWNVHAVLASLEIKGGCFRCFSDRFC